MSRPICSRISHGVLGHHAFIAAAPFDLGHLLQRHVVRQRVLGDHDAGGVRDAWREMPSRPLAFSTSVRVASLLSYSALSCGSSLQRPLQRHAHRQRGHHLGDAVNLIDRIAQHTADVAHCGLCAKRSEGNDLRHSIAAVAVGDILDHLAAPLIGEVHVDIRHVLALGLRKRSKARFQAKGSISVMPRQ